MTGIQTAGMSMNLQSWRGYSAYEIAVQNGFTGTQSEWLQSLKGDPGPSAAEMTVNNVAAVDGNITLRANDIYLESGLATTVKQVLDECLTQDRVEDSLESDDASRVLSAKQGSVLHTEIGKHAKAFFHTITISPNGWEEQPSGDYRKTMYVESVTSNTEQTAVVVSPSANRVHEERYTTYGIRAIAQGNSTLTFSALVAPEETVTVHALVIRKEVSA